MTKYVPHTEPDFDTTTDGMSVAVRDRGGQHHALVTAQFNPLTGGNDFSGDVSTLKLPAGVTDLTSGVSGGSASVIGAQHTQAATPADTAEHDLFSVEIPSGSMGANSAMVVDWLVSMTNSAGTKTIRAYIGDTMVFALAQTAIQSFRGQMRIANRGSVTSQISGAHLALTGYMGGGSGSLPSTFSINFGAAQTLRVTGQKSSAGDAFALESVVAKVEG